MRTFIARMWCRQFHRQPMWPIRGKYICARCLQEYPVNWEDRAVRAAEKGAAAAPVPETAWLPPHAGGAWGTVKK